MTPGQVTLPPGQRVRADFPRFGTHADRPAPAVPADPAITIRGPGIEAFDVPLTALADLPRREITADFHCVAGWSATNLRWEGVSFEAFYRSLIAPALPPGTTVTHVLFKGLDGYRAAAQIEDCLADDVLIAEHLDGSPLEGDHGAPARLVTPGQYGYVNCKHLSRIEVLTSEPRNVNHSLALRILAPHPRARVWEEERHRYLPAWALRHAYRALTKVLLRRTAEATEDRGRS
jgi:DMSO/TMAO reductase YedYZ molybdopterin-dependent catalytic subunit